MEEISRKKKSREIGSERVIEMLDFFFFQKGLMYTRGEIMSRIKVDGRVGN